MIIRYLGHSSFYLRGARFSVVTDPFSDIGYELERVKADFCTVSHGHYDHDNVSGVDVRNVIRSSEHGFLAIKTYHDARSGALRGENTVFKFEMDGIEFCHMGDVGEYCSTELVEQIGETDVLFIPVGGNYTIDYREAINYVEAIKPKIVIPMHYKTRSCTIDIDGVEKFARRIAGVERTGREIEIFKESLPDERVVYIMDNGEF